MKRLFCILSMLIIGLFSIGCSQQANQEEERPEVAPREPTAEPTTQADEATSQTYTYNPSMLTLFRPLPAVVAPEDYELSEELVTLGRMLYYEPRMSINQEMSCNTCHQLDDYGVEPLATSLSHDGQPGHRNAPTVYNAALHIAQFWDGRAATVEEQALGPILAAGEMGMPDGDYVEEILATIPGYEPLFAAAFPDDPNPITFENVGTAIGAFERQLVTPSRFDNFLAGEETALTAAEKEGLATFVQVGCTTCHMGTAVGGELYRKLGLIEPYETEDVGRFAVTNEEIDRHVFKVPSLRNITQTGPYFHDGSIETLEEAVWIMAKHQLGRDLTDTEITSIITFLKTLEGEIPTDYITEPTLPDSGPDTPSVNSN